MGGWLDWVILWVFSNLGDSMIQNIVKPRKRKLNLQLEKCFALPLSMFLSLHPTKKTETGISNKECTHRVHVCSILRKNMQTEKIKNKRSGDFLNPLFRRGRAPARDFMQTSVFLSILMKQHMNTEKKFSSVFFSRNSLRQKSREMQTQKFHTGEFLEASRTFIINTAYSKFEKSSYGELHPSRFPFHFACSFTISLLYTTSKNIKTAHKKCSALPGACCNSSFSQF